MMNKDLEKIQEKALLLFRTGITQDSLVERLGTVEKAIPIYGPGLNIVSYFVGITVKDKIVGFMQFNLKYRLMRYSTFQRHKGSLEGCPLAKSWLDSNYILSLAKTKISPCRELMTPYLTYDKEITRVVWAVKTRNEHMRTIYVAGKYVYSYNN